MRHVRLIPSADAGTAAALAVERDPDELQLLGQDAAAMQGSGASGLIRPADARQLARWFAEHPGEPVLVQGALTSLTGGATPDGEIVVSTGRMRGVEMLSGGGVRVGAGVLLAELQAFLTDRALYYPPAPTHDGATLGGNASTNAAGAATFKYGTTRDWVRWARIVLRSGDMLELRRGEVMVHPGEDVLLHGTATYRVPIPTYRTPALKKVAMGYYVREPLDLLDIFLGSEGTLGVITDLELAVVPMPRVVTGLVFTATEGEAVALTGRLRDASGRGAGRGRESLVDVRSVEFFDREALGLLRERDELREDNVTVPHGAGACLLFEQEVAAGISDGELIDQLTDGGEGTPMGALMALLREAGVVETTELAMPSDGRRRRQLAAMREAVPLAISELLRERQREDPAVHKAGGDMIVPFDRFGEMLERYREAFVKRGLRVVIFGHISDGNVHPNALVENGAQMEAAREALMELAGEVKRLGGAPMSEHGVGKHPWKQAMLEAYWGEEAMGQMMAVKEALDPSGALGRGVLWGVRHHHITY